VRLGGDEFALFVQAASAEEARVVSARVVEAAASSSPAAFSRGTAHRGESEGPSSLLTRAEQVLYASKGRSLNPTRRRPPAADGGES
jgi:PleD family two-component response regulator